MTAPAIPTTPLTDITRPVTILRIKRKRTDEPLEGFMVNPGPTDSPGKKVKKDTTTTAAPTMFRLAETVTVDIFGDHQQARHITKKIGRLSQRQAIKSIERSQVSSDTGIQQKKVQLAADKVSQAKMARFRVISKNRMPINLSLESMSPLAKELPSNDTASITSPTTCHVLDAIKESVDPIPLVGTLSAKERRQDLAADLTALLNYQLMTPSTVDDYVYDLYYAVGDNDAEVDHRTTDQYASLFWNGSFDDEWDELMASSDSEHAEDDMDSNAEDFYANDYPEEEEWSEEAYSDGSYTNSGYDFSIIRKV
ncbi:hypothetical protein IWQ61_006027 [Dispira simplex]|nr:hypothetical protein IWQ61_006027 [Dispira simplex]